jgi:hypothetical protein
MLFALIPAAWLSVLMLFAALCRAASYGDAEHTFNEQDRADRGRTAKLERENGFEVLA